MYLVTSGVFTAFFRELYSGFTFRADVYTVSGVANEFADKCSRSCRVGDPRRVVERKDLTFPPLTDFTHPYCTLKVRDWWCV